MQKVLAHKLSSIRDVRFIACILLDALSQYQKSAYLNSDMGSEYTSSVYERIKAFHSILTRELIYPNQFRDNFELIAQISRYIRRYNYEWIRAYESVKPADVKKRSTYRDISTYVFLILPNSDQFKNQFVVTSYLVVRTVASSFLLKINGNQTKVINNKLSVILPWSISRYWCLL